MSPLCEKRDSFRLLGDIIDEKTALRTCLQIDGAIRTHSCKCNSIFVGFNNTFGSVPWYVL